MAGRSPTRTAIRAELVRTVLSQNTSDTNRDLAYERLRRAFDTWEEVRDAPSDAVIEAIRPGGLGNTKAPRIQAILRTLGARSRSRLAAATRRAPRRSSS